MPSASESARADLRMEAWMIRDHEQLIPPSPHWSEPEWQAGLGGLIQRFDKAPSGSLDRSRLLDLLAQAPPRMAKQLGDRFWTQDKSSFNLNHLLVFAAHGVLNCESALDSYVGQRQRSLCMLDIEPAVFLALRGNGAGRPILQRAWDWTDLRAGGAGRALLVAHALEQLDSRGALAEMRLRVAHSVRSAKNEGSFELARRLALEAEAFERMIVPETGRIELSELAWFGEKLGRRCQERGNENECPDTHIDSNLACHADAGAPNLPRVAWPI